MFPAQKIVTNIPRAQVNQAVEELEQSIEVDRTEISHYRILAQTLSVTSLRAVGEPRPAMGLDFALREKDQVTKLLQRLVQLEYDEINGKQEVVSFLNLLLAYAT